MKLLSLLLCFEMIMAPVQGSFLISRAEAQSLNCGVGQEEDRTLNRCLTKAEVIAVGKAVDSCGTDKACYERNAKDALNKQGEKNPDLLDNDGLFKNDGSGTQKKGVQVATAAVIGIPLLIATNSLVNRMKMPKGQRSSYKCSPNSLKLMYAGAGALAAGEIVGYFVHKGKLNDIQKEWDKSVVPKEGSSVDNKKVEATEAQSQAFEYLAQNEDQVAKTTRLKKGFYLAATGLFAAGTAAAVIEQIQLTKDRLTLTVPKPGTTAEDIDAARKRIDKYTCSTDRTEDVAGKRTGKDEHSEKADTYKIKDAADKNLADTKKCLSVGGDCTADDVTKYNNAVENQANARRALEKFQTLERVNHNVKLSDGKNPYQVQIKGNITAPNTKNPSQTPVNLEKPKQNVKATDGQTPPPPATIKVPPITKPATTPSAQEPAPYKGQSVDKWNTNQGSSLTPIFRLKEKQIAAHNLSTAKDAEQFMQLMAEFEAVEFDNYSSLSYLAADEVKELKKISFTQQMASLAASAFLPEAEAGDVFGKVLGGLAGVAAVGPMVNSILKGVKFKNNKPVAPEMLAEDKEKVDNWISTAIGKPYTRIALNGVMGTWMGVMSVHMGNQAKDSEARAVKLREMKKDFIGGTGLMNCSDADRIDSTKPRCFCYTPDNKRNMARASTKVCSLEFVGLETEKPELNAISGVKVCMTQNMDIDPACSCRNTKGADGKNTCLKSSAGLSASGFSPGTFKMMSSVSAPADDLFNGNTSGANISDAAGINAARVNKASKDLLAKTDPKLAKESDKLEMNLEKAILGAAGGYSNGSNSSSLPSSPAAAAAALDKELEKNKDIDVTTAGGSAPRGGSDNSGVEETPEFGLNSQDAAIQEIEINDVMAKNIDFGNSDIDTRSDKSIFETLSDTYKQKGMKRLFEDKKETQKAP